MSSPEQHTDVAIIGAGPVGLFAIFECGMLRMKCHVIDALDVIGGQCAALYPEKPIYDIPGYPSIDAADLIERLNEQTAPFSPVYHLGQQVVSLSRAEGDRWLVETSAGTRINAQGRHRRGRRRRLRAEPAAARRAGAVRGQVGPLSGAPPAGLCRQAGGDRGRRRQRRRLGEQPCRGRGQYHGGPPPRPSSAPHRKASPGWSN